MFFSPNSAPDSLTPSHTKPEAAGFVEVVVTADVVRVVLRVENPALVVRVVVAVVLLVAG